MKIFSVLVVKNSRRQVSAFEHAKKREKKETVHAYLAPIQGGLVVERRKSSIWKKNEFTWVYQYQKTKRFVNRNIEACSKTKRKKEFTQQVVKPSREISCRRMRSLKEESDKSCTKTVFEGTDDQGVNRGKQLRCCCLSYSKRIITTAISNQSLSIHLSCL